LTHKDCAGCIPDKHSIAPLSSISSFVNLLFRQAPLSSRPSFVKRASSGPAFHFSPLRVLDSRDSQDLNGNFFLPLDNAHARTRSPLSRIGTRSSYAPNTHPPLTSLVFSFCSQHLIRNQAYASAGLGVPHPRLNRPVAATALSAASATLDNLQRNINGTFSCFSRTR